MNDYLKLQAVRKMFGNTCVLDDVDLEIREGELVTLLGPPVVEKAHCYAA